MMKANGKSRLNIGFRSRRVLAACFSLMFAVVTVKGEVASKADPSILRESGWTFQNKNLNIKKPRVIITTDGEVDDQNGFIRLLLYANEFDIEGLVYSSSQWHYAGDGEGTLFTSQMPNTAKRYGERSELRWTGTQWIQDFVSLYAKNYNNLLKHDPGYPSPEHLTSVIRVGNIEFEGEMKKVTEGSELIKEILLDDKHGPVHIQVWGGTNTFARALKSIEEQYKGTSQWERIQAKVSEKVIVYIILGQDVTFLEYILPNWPDIKTIFNRSQPRGFAYGWRQLVPKAFHSLMNGDWYKKNILSHRGPLLARYYTYGDGQPVEGDYDVSFHSMKETRRKGHQQHDFISEWDSPAWFFSLDYMFGLRSMEDPPSFGGLGGRFVQSAQNPSVWADIWEDVDQVTDFNPHTGEWDPSYPQSRWIPILQNDFAARAEWMVNEYEDSNHAPFVKLTHPTSLRARAGQQVHLSATASDPDGDDVEYVWWHYREAGTLKEKLAIEGSESRTASFRVPPNTESGDTIHILLQVTDKGNPPMTRFKRIVITLK